jgi:peptide/nickel transport system substrate-binding protein
MQINILSNIPKFLIGGEQKMSRSKKTMLVVGLLIIASMVLAACQPGETTTVVETVIVEGTPVIVEVPAEVETEPLPDTLVICLGQEPETLYIYGGNMLASSQVQEAVYDGPIDNRSFGYQATILEKIPSLADGDSVINVVTASEGDSVVVGGDPVILEAGMTLRPAGCNADNCAITFEGGSIDLDQMVVTFSLLPGLMWSDGAALTAQDSIYAHNLANDPDTPASKYVGERSTSYEALDDTTIVWTGLPGYIDSTYFTNFWAPLPEHAWGQFTALELLEAEEAARTPLGWGAYVIDEWVAGESISLTKNTNYYRADEGLPYFENVVYRMVGENSNANIAAILSGECDIVDQTSHLDDQSELLLELQNAGQVAATFVTGTVWEHADLGINPVSYDDGYDVAAGDRPDFFGDVRTRRAIAMCFDRQAVVDTVMFGQSVVLHTYLPPQHPLFNANVTQYPFDVEAGSALLEEVGWVMGDDGVRVSAGVEGIEDGTPLEFSYWTTNATQRQQATQILAQTAAECGMQVNLEYWVAGEYFADGPEGPVFGRRFDIGQFAWLTGVEPPCYLYSSYDAPGPGEVTFGEVPWLVEAIGDAKAADSPAFVSGWGGSNDPGYASAAFDKACDTAQQSLPGQAAYDENHLLAQVIFADDLPVIPLYLRLKLAGTRPDMCGFIMDPTANSEMWNIEEFGYGALCDM